MGVEHVSSSVMMGMTLVSVVDIGFPDHFLGMREAYVRSNECGYVACDDGGEEWRASSMGVECKFEWPVILLGGGMCQGGACCGPECPIAIEDGCL
jgi:hypothetical protein